MGDTLCIGCSSAVSAPPFERILDPDTGTEFGLFSCASCGLVFSPLPKDFPLDEWYSNSEFYAEHEYAEHHGPVESDWRFLMFLSAAGRHRLKGRLLDIGCGEGGFLSMLKARNWNGSLEGVDLHAERAGRRPDGIRIEVARFEEFARRRREEPYDVVTIFDTIEHFPEVSATFTELARLIAYDGHLAVGVPNSERLRVTGEWGEFDYPPNHVTRWNLKTLRGFLERHGFEIVEWSVAFPWPRRFVEPVFNKFWGAAVGLVQPLLSRPSKFGGGAGAKVVWSGPLAAPVRRKRIQLAFLRLLSFALFPALIPVSLVMRLLRPRSGSHLFVLARRKPG
ncbi:MAG: class I SAM-dependent methyltransferase [Elusimicrobiota bacterium]